MKRAPPQLEVAWKGKVAAVSDFWATATAMVSDSFMPGVRLEAIANGATWASCNYTSVASLLQAGRGEVGLLGEEMKPAMWL